MALPGAPRRVSIALVAGLAAAGACSSGRTAETPAPAAKEGRRGGKPSVFPAPERFTDIGTREPSGIVYHPRLKHLFVVGDEGVVVELDKTAKVLSVHKLKGNLEDVTVHTPTGNLVIISEQKSELIYYDPVAQSRKARWQLDTASLLGDEAGAEKGSSANGFEGLGFREDRRSPGGGVFYLARQKAPHMIIGFTFDPERAPSGPLAPQVVSRWSMPRAELRSAFFAPPLERFLVLSKKGLTIVRLDGSVEATVALPGEQPEGVCLDDDGTMWVADDPGRVLMKFPGALAALRALPR
jgi:uncharacterized protein YjiK